MTKCPKYPISVLFAEDSEIEIYKTESELVTALEWFDSSDPEWKAQVVDVTGVKVYLKVEALKIVKLEYENT